MTRRASMSAIRAGALNLLFLGIGVFVASAAPADDSLSRLAAAALERTNHQVTYDGSYRSIPYPSGDVPDHLGVCTDVVVRSYRRLGIDLQRLVHEDMSASFDAYPNLWGLTRPDPNIDHRRVPNLERFLERQGAAVAVSRAPADYRPGDLVTWRLPGNLPHIGVVVEGRSPDGVPWIVHNIGAGPQREDVLFTFRQVGHYRWSGPAADIDNDADPDDREDP